MRRCTDCGEGMKELVAKTQDGVPYQFFRCSKCGEEVLNMAQLHGVAEKYRRMKRYHAKLSKWGVSLGMRIPKELAQSYSSRRAVKSHSFLRRMA